MAEENKTQMHVAMQNLNQFGRTEYAGGFYKSLKQTKQPFVQRKKSDFNVQLKPL